MGNQLLGHLAGDGRPHFLAGFVAVAERGSGRKQAHLVEQDDDLNLYTYVGGDPGNKTDPTGAFADTVVDIGFIAYDLYSLATSPSWSNATALGLDVAGALVPFVTGAGQAYRAAHTAHQIAKEADKIGTAGMTARAAGTAKHTEAARLTRERMPGASVEQPFKGGETIANRAKGSSVPDVVVQTPGGRQPLDYKFGQAGTGEARNAANKANVGTSLNTIDIRPGVPPPGRVNGLGAACNAARDSLNTGPCTN